MLSGCAFSNLYIGDLKAGGAISNLYDGEYKARWSDELGFVNHTR